MMRSRPVAGRHLGWSEADLASKPYADFLNPKLSPLPDHIRDALDRGPVAEPRLPPVQAAAQSLFGAAPVLEDGFALTADGAMHVAARTDMPGVTPEMIDWWFGWHSDGPERYKLWHPNAHVYAAWSAPPPAGTRGRARYVGQTSIVDEYIGSNLIRAAIQFVQPRVLGLADASLDDPRTGDDRLRPDRAWRFPHRCRVSRASRPPHADRKRNALAILDWRPLRRRPRQHARRGDGARRRGW